MIDFQLQKLTRLIQASSILQQAEKDAWLAMLPVMSDKQASELVEILSPRIVQPETHSEVPKDFSLDSTQLHHITNLPADFVPTENFGNNQNALPAPETSHASAKLSYPLKEPQLDQVIKEKELVEPVEEKHPEPAKKNFIPLDKLASKEEAFHDLNWQNVQSKMHKRTTRAIGGAQQIESLEDCLRIGPTTLQLLGFEGVRKKLSIQVEKHGYYNVLLSLEKSPLYKSYIATGLALASNSQEDLPLTKQEFEQTADLISSLAQDQSVL